MWTTDASSLTRQTPVPIVRRPVVARTDFEIVTLAIYREIGEEYEHNRCQTDPFERLNFLPISAELLERLFNLVSSRQLKEMV